MQSAMEMQMVVHYCFQGQKVPRSTEYHTPTNHSVVCGNDSNELLMQMLMELAIIPLPTWRAAVLWSGSFLDCQPLVLGSIAREKGRFILHPNARQVCPVILALYTLFTGAELGMLQYQSIHPNQLKSDGWKRERQSVFFPNRKRTMSKPIMVSNLMYICFSYGEM